MGDLASDLSGLNDRIIDAAAVSHPSLTRGQVWCRSCGRTEKVSTPGAMRRGWPKCCGYTMTIDNPEEQVALACASSDRTADRVGPCSPRTGSSR
jgi:hypothetical protein